jgi:Zn-dependent protease with chaperone function
MRDFFQRQELARKKTRRLLAFFIMAVLLIIVCVYLVVRGLYFWVHLENLNGPIPVWDPAMFATVAVIVLVLVIGGSLYKVGQLREGGFRVAEMLGGRRVPTGTGNPEERRLLNVVEEMAIASGVPVPDTYIMERERGINAFAAGFGPDDAVICITRGALHLLSRDELQGVVAHEFSHLLNADSLINIRLMGWLHGILLISLTGEGIVRGLGRTRSRSGGVYIVLGFALYLLGGLGVFFGKLIKSAVSRQREYLADASAVQFTRNPFGLAGALKKIGGLVGEGRISHPLASEASHMYFSNGLPPNWLAALATHPPLLERILQLDPRFDGAFPAVDVLPAPEPPPRPAGRRMPAPAGAAEIVSGAAAAAILETVGAPMQEHAGLARALIAELPEDMRSATRDPAGACALIYLLLLDRNEAVRTGQLELLRAAENPAVSSEVEKLTGHLPIAPRLRLPLIDLSLPALRQLSHDQYAAFRERVEELTCADGRLSLFEFTLRHVVLRHLGARFGEPRRQVVQIYGIRGVLWECSCVLSLLARVGHRDEEAEKAFARGQRILRETRAEPEFLPAGECTAKALEQALDTLAVTSPLIKRKLLAACLECLMHDQRVSAGEVELFRAVADALGCPVPPWLSYGDDDLATAELVDPAPMKSGRNTAFLPEPSK